jgi:hypothetical protein
VIDIKSFCLRIFMVSHAAEHGVQTQHQGANCSQHSNLIRLPLNAMECAFWEFLALFCQVVLNGSILAGTMAILSSSALRSAFGGFVSRY